VCVVSSTGYEIHIRGRVSEQLLTVFEGMEATVQSVETVLRGPVRDQAALHGLLDRIQALGLELVEVRRLPEDSHPLHDPRPLDPGGE
jgi:hypothetical protein